MATNYVQDGKTVTYTAGGALTSGDVVGLPSQDANGKFIGIVADTVASGETVTLLCEGVFTITKTAGETWAIGDDVYVTGAGAFTATATANQYGGVVWEAAASAATSAKVRINFGGDPR